MQFIIVISMIFAVLVALFAIQNASIITVNFLWLKINLSQAVVILGSALVGILFMLPFDIVKGIKHSMKINELNNKIKRLNEQINMYENQAINNDLDQTLIEELEQTDKTNDIYTE